MFTEPARKLGAILSYQKLDCLLGIDNTGYFRSLEVRPNPELKRTKLIYTFWPNS
jgi:hypothetical protein